MKGIWRAIRRAAAAWWERNIVSDDPYDVPAPEPSNDPNPHERKHTMTERTKLSPPWELLFQKYKALFAKDPDVEVVQTGANSIELRVRGFAKADALSRLLPARVEFGNATVHVSVIPDDPDDPAGLLEAAFRGNGAFAGVVRAGGTAAAPERAFALFRPEAAQYWADNFGDPDGNETALYADLARELLAGGPADGVPISSAPLED